MIQAKVIYKIDFPRITLQKELENIARDIIIPDMQRRIKMRRAIDGGEQTKNEPATAARKGNKPPLIDSGTMVNSSFLYQKEGKDTVRIFLGPERAEIGLLLQTGISTGHGIKRYPFFGISIFAYRKAMKYMREKLKEQTNG